jgi:small GTP-binding protein
MNGYGGDHGGGGVTPLVNQFPERAQPHDVVIRIVVLGDPKTGKTTLIENYNRNGVPSEEQYPKTIGTDFICKRILLGAHSLFVMVWDTAGDEQNKVITGTYLRQAQGVIMLYDMLNGDSFKRLANWKALAEEYGSQSGEPAFMVVGNKSDLAARAIVDRDQAQLWAKRNFCFYSETSAKTGANVMNTMNEFICISFLKYVYQANQSVVPHPAEIQRAGIRNYVYDNMPSDKQVYWLRATSPDEIAEITARRDSFRRQLAVLGVRDYGTSRVSSIQSGLNDMTIVITKSGFVVGLDALREADDATEDRKYNNNTGSVPSSARSVGSSAPLFGQEDRGDVEIDESLEYDDFPGDYICAFCWTFPLCCLKRPK